MLRTLARSRQIEAEERGSTRRPPVRGADSFTDDPEEEVTAANLLRDDQIDFLDHGVDEYRDDFTDEDDVFRYGDGNDEEGAIGLDKHPSQRLR